MTQPPKPSPPATLRRAPARHAQPLATQEKAIATPSAPTTPPTSPLDKNLVAALKHELLAAKAEDIKCYDLLHYGKNSYTDFIMIATAASTLHLKALSAKMQRTFKNFHTTVIGGHKYNPLEERWVIIDGGSIIVHLFMQEDRDYYALDDKLHEDLTANKET